MATHSWDNKEALRLLMMPKSRLKRKSHRTSSLGMQGLWIDSSLLSTAFRETTSRLTSRLAPSSSSNGAFSRWIRLRSSLRIQTTMSQSLTRRSFCRTSPTSWSRALMWLRTCSFTSNMRRLDSKVEPTGHSVCFSHFSVASFVSPLSPMI